MRQARILFEMGRWVVRGMAVGVAMLAGVMGLAVSPATAGEVTGALMIGRLLTWLASRLLRSHPAVHAAAFFGVAVIVSMVAEMPLDRAFVIYGVSAAVWALWDLSAPQPQWRCRKCNSDQEGAFCDKCGAEKGNSMAAGVCLACRQKNRKNARCCAGCGAQLTST